MVRHDGEYQAPNGLLTIDEAAARLGELLGDAVTAKAIERRIARCETARRKAEAGGTLAAFSPPFGTIQSVKRDGRRLVPAKVIENLAGELKADAQRGEQRRESRQAATGSHGTSLVLVRELEELNARQAARIEELTEERGVLRERAGQATARAERAETQLSDFLAQRGGTPTATLTYPDGASPLARLWAWMTHTPAGEGDDQAAAEARR